MLQLFKKYGNYKQGEEPWKKYGRINDWNVDLVPKLLMANGELTNILVSTDVTRYLEHIGFDDPDSAEQVRALLMQGKDSDADVVPVAPGALTELCRGLGMSIAQLARRSACGMWE